MSPRHVIIKEILHEDKIDQRQELKGLQHSILYVQFKRDYSAQQIPSVTFNNLRFWQNLKIEPKS